MRLRKIVSAMMFFASIAIVDAAVPEMPSAPDYESRAVTTSQLTDEQNKKYNELRTQNALELGITQEDLAKYDAIMGGPKGNFFRRGEANYFYVLGAEAKSDEEALHYARLWVRAEGRYYTNLGNMLRAYDAASIEYFGENPVMFDIIGRGNTANSNPVNAQFHSSRVGRVKVFIQLDDCPTCDATVLRELDKVNKGTIQGLDIYIANANGDNQAIRRWATMIKLDPDQVKQRLVTLNHASTEQANSKKIPSIEISFE